MAPSRRRKWALAAAVPLAGATALFLTRPPPRYLDEPAPPAYRSERDSPSFVGRAACASCHAAEAARFAGSHHDRAMQEATRATVLGDFDGATFLNAGVTSTFFWRDGKPMVRTDGPDGALHDYEVRFTFGVAPLQQYLLAMDGGRLQALSIAWDTRPKSKGGQRWFHLHPEARIEPSDPLHWTKRLQNWNASCADCHSTAVRRNFDPMSGRYATTYAEIDVACEACHGPGSRHLGWAKREPGSEDPAGKGLPVRLDERRGVAWEIDPVTGNGKRSRPRAGTTELQTCGRCHARRGELGNPTSIGAAIGDGYRVALLEPGLYRDDGQNEDEVYEYGSFLQSRMFAGGVTCSDCHEPHGLGLRAEGSGVCLQCHAPDRYRTAAHHHHREGSAGAACIACHMPARTYMVIDERRDHSFRIPRPDRTVAIGTPNACEACHAKRGAAWAAARIRAWFGAPKPGFQRFAEALHAGAEGAPGALAALLGVAVDTSEPAIARAGALARLGRIPDAATLELVKRLLGDVDPLVRRAAAQAYGGAPPAALRDLLALLGDPIRDVRLEAARRIADAPAESLREPERRARERALEDYLEAQREQPDRPEAQLELAAVLRDLGRSAEAVVALERALALDPAFAPAAVNLADLMRELGREAEAEAVLRRALSAAPRSAALHHALGLWLVRAKRMSDALVELGRAADLAPEDPQLAYVDALALGEAGRNRDARRVLERTLARHPYHAASLQALARLERDAGNVAAAERHERRLAELGDARQRR